MRHLWLSVVLALVSCATPRPSPAAFSDPYVLVLGTAQDAGLPQLACQGDACAAARRDSHRRRLVTSILLVDPRSGKRWLFDASPDLAEQVELCDGEPAGRSRTAPAGARPALFDGIFLTHAHLGHYTGLLELGPEAYGSAPVPTYVSKRMGDFLRANGPWSLLVERGILDLQPLEPGVPIVLAEDLTVVPHVVPHRDEFSDTLGFEIRGPKNSLLYLPDIDKWERWSVPVEEVLARVQHALLDATFFDSREIPERDMSEIPHPFIVESMARFEALPRAERGKIIFTHLNHSNPAADPSSAAARSIRAAGMHIARRGERFGL